MRRIEAVQDPEVRAAHTTDVRSAGREGRLVVSRARQHVCVCNLADRRKDRFASCGSRSESESSERTTERDT